MVIKIDQTTAYRSEKGWFRYRKKPVQIEATEMSDYFEVLTLEGVMTGKPGDFLIRGIKDELYPCKRDIFLASYENV